MASDMDSLVRLTHWYPAMFIVLIITDTNNGLVPCRHQAIICISDDTSIMWDFYKNMFFNGFRCYKFIFEFYLSSETLVAKTQFDKQNLLMSKHLSSLMVGY